ncbi:heterokaryon incompatibility protein-domain-containing protein [Xylaria sp. FL1042]|nr:heterokaryon incompatibility protein-domain-containing protein [Xylaria sp. FL1042]
MASAYEHQPLTLPNSTRVLVLEPALSLKAPIQCSLDEVDLDNLTSSSAYEALSYVWGDRAGSLPVLCHGKQLLVTPNCHDALVHLRPSFRRRRLFVDAICIDQRDETCSRKEREHQIQSMGQVYEKARRVVVWLGKPHPATSRLFWLLRLMEWNTNATEQGISHFDESYVNKDLNALVKGTIWILDLGQDELAKVKEAYLHLLKNAWFSRVWTFQEQVLASRRTCLALCGHHQIKLATIDQAVLGALNRKWPHTQVENFNTIIARGAVASVKHEIKNPNFSLGGERLLWLIIRNLNSTIPHDKIFGIYAILAQLGLNLPRPDYSKTAAEIFETAARGIIQQTKSLNILSQSSRKASITEGLPSWVPDWLVKPSANMPQCGDEIFSGQTYKAAKDSEWTLSKAAGMGRLYLQGFMIGKVEFIAVSSTIGTFNMHARLPDFGSFSQACQRWCQHIATFPTYCTGCPTLEAAKRILLMDSHPEIPDSIPETQKYKFQSFSELFDIMLYPNCKLHCPETIKKELVNHFIFIKSLCNEHNDEDTAQEIDLGVVLISYLSFRGVQKGDKPSLISMILRGWANYALMVLDTGHFARGLYVCEEGDAVALLAGCDFPVALRPDGNGNYRFVAPLYIDGIMYGEAWPEDEATLEEIVLV